MKYDFNINDIMEILPHRYPFLLVDGIIDFKSGKSAVGIKNVTINEPFFTGHFPNNPVMPGVLIIEALAQTAGFVVMQSKGRKDFVYFMTIDKVKFRKPVKPGDVLELHVECEQTRGNVSRFKGTAKVDGKTVAEGILSAMIAEEKK